MASTITRNDAIAILTEDGLAKMLPEERTEQLNCMMHEDWSSAPEWQHISLAVQREFEAQSEIQEPSNPRYDPVLRLWFKYQFTGARNEYIAGLLRNLGHGCESVVGQASALAPCPCCGACSLDEPDYYDICRVCWWEDDGQDNDNADKVMGGSNYHLSLTQGRINFLKSGISDPTRTDLCEHQEPIHKYPQGRVFVLSADGQTVLEPDANWQGTVVTENGS